MDQVVKIQSNQTSFDQSGTKNNVDFDIPTGLGNLNLANSYVSFVIKPEVTVTGGTADDITNPIIGYNRFDGANPGLVIPDTAALVRNVFMSSQIKGKLEDIRHVDVLKNTLAAYNRDVADITGEVNKLADYQRATLVPAQCVNELHKDAGKVSQGGKSQEVIIPLKNLMNLCKTEAYDTDRMGTTRLHLEMNFDRLVSDMDTILLDTAAGAGGSAPFQNKSGHIAADGFGGNLFDTLGGAPGGLISGGAGTNVNTLLSNVVFRSEDKNPYYIGQPLRVRSSDNAADAGAYVNRDQQLRVTNVEKVPAAVGSASGFRVRLTLSGNVNSAALAAAREVRGTGGGAGTAPTITFCDPANLVRQSLDFERIELVAYVNNSGEKAPPSLAYSTFLSEEDNFTAAEQFQRVYYIPPAVKNVYVMFFGDPVADFRGAVQGLTAAQVAAKPVLRSSQPNLKQYRITIDNKEVTDRPVVMDSPIHYDMISKVYLNNNQKLKSILQRQFNLDSHRNTLQRNNLRAESGVQCRMIAFPVPFKPVQQALQLELEGEGGNLTGHHIVYYEQVRQV